MSGGLTKDDFLLVLKAKIGLRNGLDEKRQPFPAQAKGSMPAGLRKNLFTPDEQVCEQVTEQPEGEINPGL